MSKPKKDKTFIPPDPVNVSDGIPDRTDAPSRKRLIGVLLAWAAWMGFLLYVLLAAQGN